MNNEIVITYELLYDLLRNERDKESLQKLDNTFIKDVKSYIEEKKQIAQKQGQSIFQEADQNNHQQLLNIFKIVRELFDRREQKIITLARDDVRTKGKLIDTSPLLPEEKELYDYLVSLLSKQRAILYDDIFNEKPKVLKTEPKKDTIELTFEEAVSAFVGPDMKTYGPYAQGEKAELPEKVAQLLQNQNKAK